MTASSGVTAALLVQAGWTGVDDILTGKDNFFSAYNPHAEPGGLIDQLGERYEVTRTNIKKWPVGSPIQAALDALQGLRAQHSTTRERGDAMSSPVVRQPVPISGPRRIDIASGHELGYSIEART
jgi:2-methylcitrate dehydratase PrpD